MTLTALLLLYRVRIYCTTDLLDTSSDVYPMNRSQWSRSLKAFLCNLWTWDSYSTWQLIRKFSSELNVMEATYTWCRYLRTMTTTVDPISICTVRRNSGAGRALISAPDDNVQGSTKDAASNHIISCSFVLLSWSSWREVVGWCYQAQARESTKRKFVMFGGCRCLHTMNWSSLHVLHIIMFAGRWMSYSTRR